MEGLRRKIHRVSSGRFETQSHSWWTCSEGVDPEGGNGRERENGLTVDVLERKTDQENNDFGDVTREQVLFISLCPLR